MSMINEAPNIGITYTQWAEDNGCYIPTPTTIKTIPAGFYEPSYNGTLGYHLILRSINTDELYELPSPELQDIILDIKKFWDRKSNYEKFGFLHKRGILLYGPPGSGKSGIIQLCVKHLINNLNGVVINISNGDQADYYSNIIPQFRQIEQTRPLIVIMEDIEAIVNEGSWTTSIILNLLDGSRQIDNIVYIATTNYPEKLEERVTNRPSRFDRRYEIDMPNADVRESYIRNKLSKEDLDKINMNEWIKETDGMSIAHLRELIISFFVLDNSFETTIDRLNGLKIKPIITKFKNKKIGFSSTVALDKKNE